MKVDKNEVFKWILRLYEALDNSKLDKVELKSVRDEVIKLKNYLGVDNYNQTYIYAIIVVRKIENITIDLTRIMNFLDLKLHDNLYVINDIENLLNKKLIKFDEERRGSITHVVLCNFTISKQVLQSILNSDKIDKVLLNQQNDTFQFLKEVSGAIGRQIAARDKDFLYELVEKIENENKHLSFIENLTKVSVDIEYRALMYEIACDFFETLGKTSNLKFKLISVFGVREGLIILKEFINNQSTMQYSKLIEITNSQFADDVQCNLTDKAAELIFGEDAKVLKFNKQTNNIQLLDSQFDTELFFDADIKEQIDFIEQVVRKDKFPTLQQRLIDKGMTAGIVVLLHGEAGTGKSAMVRSIAKNTNRRILEVQGSQKDKYYGETERKTKELFDNYNALCEQDKDNFPLMVIDEADQLITRRLVNANDTTENTSNAQQNIILTALERNKGIIFLTTNLVGNMLDAGALERRINFKIEFKKPSLKIAKQVWKSNFPFLVDGQIDFLNSEYLFTPAEISNIQKKVIFDEVISGQQVSFEKIIIFCQTEKVNTANSKAIGFNPN